MYRRDMIEVNKPSITVFDHTNLADTILLIKRNIDAEYKEVYAENGSIIVKTALLPQAQWNDKYWENAVNHFMFKIDVQGTVTMLKRFWQVKEKMRMYRAKSIMDVVQRINGYLHTVGQKRESLRSMRSILMQIEEQK